MPTFRSLAGSQAFALVELSTAATYAVAYAASGTIEGTEIMGTLTSYQRPPDVRLDLTFPDDDGDRLTFRSYVSPGRVVVCQVAESAAQCQEADEAFGPEANASNTLARRPDDFTVIERERLAVANEQTQCYMFRPKTGVESDFEEAFICYAADGVPLMVEMKLANEDSFVLEGRIAKRDVTDEEMAAPRAP